LSKLFINSELLSPEATKENEFIANLFVALDIKQGQEIGLLMRDGRYIRDIFYGFRKSNGGYWISIGNHLERCPNVSSIGPSRSMKGGELHTNWFAVPDEEAAQ
jgi:hypothetical protein